MSSALTVDVQVACDDEVPAEPDIQKWVSAAYGQSGRAVNRSCEIAVRIVDAEEIQTLNELYRKKDGATNVLSFPGGEMAGLPDDATRMLGDIVICASIVAREAGEQGKALADHWAHMLVHGTLHLLGLDHETNTEGAEMEALETSILATGDISNPYQRS
jgi:probable rRNA maturation factor